MKRGKIGQEHWDTIYAMAENGVPKAAIGRSYDVTAPAIGYVLNQVRLRRGLPPTQAMPELVGKKNAASDPRARRPKKDPVYKGIYHPTPEEQAAALRIMKSRDLFRRHIAATAATQSPADPNSLGTAVPRPKAKKSPVVGATAPNKAPTRTLSKASAKAITQPETKPTDKRAANVPRPKSKRGAKAKTAFR